MNIYGHPLRFGVFLTPAVADPHSVVDLAVYSEIQAGLDLVTFQDHPYQPAFADTWTLLSWVAARTTRVHISGAVLSLPFRPAPVLAKAAATLDRLSGGRVELGIGPGAFWDAIETLGVRRLAPPESVTALEQAIGVIRGIWNTDQTGVLHAGGEFVRVNGAKRGPAPAHRIPIVLGAYKPRMLKLTGALADGWIPSLGYLQPGDLERGILQIDAAARAVGRDPAAIVRSLIVPPGLSAGDLAGFARAGISTFILASDDRRAIDEWSEASAQLRQRT